MKKILALILFCCSITTLLAQNPYQVKGLVTDTAATYKMVNSTITILNAKDSMLVKFSRADENGAFKLSNLKKGKFILMITYPGYADYVEDFQLDSIKPEKDFGAIDLILKSTLLKEVLIRGNAAAIRIKGDTTEFDASKYTIQPNSKVEDLLKQLPGIQVDKDGKITAQGQAVNKVLVDGEEFFGDDPTLVTKNIRGDMVDKVQLYDKKSDQAAFTGIEDGEKAKTINIVLKEDKKNGYFGKLDAGIATDKFYQGQGMINVFKGKQKVSAYGTLGNTGKIGLGWQDNSKYSGQNFAAEDGMVFISSSDEFENFNGQYSGEGIPLARNGGAHFDNKWNNNKESINANYKLGTINIDGERTNISQNTSPGASFNNESYSNFSRHQFRQKADAAYTINLDTSSTLKVVIDGTLKNSRVKTHSEGVSTREDGSRLNDNENDVNNKSDGSDFSVFAFLTHKLKKKGRSLSLSLKQSVSDENTSGYLHSLNNYYDVTGDTKLEIDQFKTNNTKSSTFNSNLTYTEPLTKAFSIIFNYGLNVTNGSANLKSFNKSADGSYSDLVSDLSNDFTLDQLSNQFGTIFYYKKDKSIIDFGAKASAVNFNQIDHYSDFTFKRNFINWNPQFNYAYTISKQSSVRFGYRGNTRQPSINQLQPVKNNNDPQNIRIGNPDLDPSFNSNFSLQYSNYKVLSNQYIYLYGNYGFTSNPIAESVTTFDNGNREYKSVNLNGKSPSNYYFGANMSRKIKALDMDAGISASTNGNKSFNLSNDELATTSSSSYQTNLNISKYKQKKYSMYFAGGPTYNVNKTTGTSNSQQQLDNSGWGFTTNSSVSVFLPAKFEIETNGNYEFRGKTKAFNETFDRFIWNASISKKFLKDETLRASISANDLLNQNVGFNRRASANSVNQSTYTTIKRFFMFSLTWDFNKMGGSAPQNQ